MERHYTEKVLQYIGKTQASFDVSSLPQETSGQDGGCMTGKIRATHSLSSRQPILLRKRGQ